MTTGSNNDFPRRIVCLSDETVETLCLLGELDRIVGISAYTSRPVEALSKPRVSGFQKANVDKILALHPDLVLAFSDVQAEITRELVLRGATVLNFNQRSIAQIFEMIRTVARIVAKPAEGDALVASLSGTLEEISASARRFPRRPRVFFEEWDDPLISGITWVEELIEIAGGELIFPELRNCGKAEQRVVTAEAVIARNPEVLLVSWCGKRMDLQAIRSRPGWNAVDAIRNEQVHEIPSACILQPGPASLSDGVRQIHAILARFAGVEVGEASARELTTRLL